MSDHELAAVWNAADALGYPAREFVRLAIITGARHTEITDMSWPEVDLTHGFWTVPADRHKTGTGVVIPLSTTMRAILESVPHRRRGGFVLSASAGEHPMRNEQRLKLKLDAATRLNQRWVIHDLRRTMRTGLSRIGVRPDIAERCIGHSTGGKIGRTYDVWAFVDERRAAFEAWDKHVQAIAAQS